MSGFNAALSEAIQWVIDGHVDEALTIAIDKHAQTWKGSGGSAEASFHGVVHPVNLAEPTNETEGAWRSGPRGLAEEHRYLG